MEYPTSLIGWIFTGFLGCILALLLAAVVAVWMNLIDNLR